MNAQSHSVGPGAAAMAGSTAHLTSSPRQSSSHDSTQNAPTGSRHDSIQDPIEPKSKVFYCENCDVSFTEKRALLRHQRESEKHLSQGGDASAPRLHQCPECAKSYKRAHDLRRHQDEVHRAKRRKRNAGDDDTGAAPEDVIQDDVVSPDTYTVPIVTRPIVSGSIPEEPLEVVQQTAPTAFDFPALLIPPEFSGLVAPVAFVDGEDTSKISPDDTTEPPDSLTILRRAFTRQRNPTASIRSSDLATQVVVHNTKFSQDHEAINLNPETRGWLSRMLSNQAEFSVSAFNARDFAFTSEKFRSIKDTLAPDLKFSHHKLPMPFNHQMMIMAYDQLAAANPKWNIKVLGASPIINLRDKTATIFIQSLVTDDGDVWAEQIIEYKFRLYSSRWLSYHVTSMRGQRLLDRPEL